MNFVRHWLPDPPAKRRPWPPGSSAGSCYFCGGPKPVWEVNGVQVCAAHKKRARAELACQECGERPVDPASLFAHMCVPCGEAWRRYTIRGNPWSVAA